MKLLILSIIAFTYLPVFCQFNIPSPIINVGNYLITDTVYMDPQGSDSNLGTFSSPLQTFDAAVQMLPWGTAGINGGHAYGLIMLKPGFYQTTLGFQQYANNWQNNSVYKDISVEGIGNVIIGGTAANLSTGHLLQLSGDHIFVKNITLQYSSGIGLLISRENPRQRNILIDHVTVDHVGSFSMLTKGIDTISIINSKSLYASRIGFENSTSPCQWPSGIKLLDNSTCIVNNCEVAYTRGEGLNFQNSTLCNAYNNKLHDNNLNFYDENSSKIMFHENLIYNTPNIGSQYWRGCLADTTAIWSGDGILIANEGSCSTGSNPVFENCRTKCSFPTVYYPNVDSVFIYNNILQKVGSGISFWEGVTSIVGINCIKNVFVFNNTFIETMGMPGASNSGFVKFFFPSYNLIANSFYGRMENIQIFNNIFTFDTLTYASMQPFKKTLHPNHPTPNAISFSNNLWIKTHPSLGLGDEVRSMMPISSYSLLDSVNSITPCFDQSYWVKAVPVTMSILTSDYLGQVRTSPTTNVGAIEYKLNCSSLGLNDFATTIEKPLLFPNPCLSCNSVSIPNLPEDKVLSFVVYNSLGLEILTGVLKNNSFETNLLPSGVYYVQLRGESKSPFQKLIIQK
jgi:hypothetical protein